MEKDVKKIKISISDKQKNGSVGTLGMPYLLRSLIDSELFDIDYHDYNFKCGRGERGTTIFCEGKKIYVDFWEYPTPTYTPQMITADFDLIIKLQHRGLGNEYGMDINNYYNYLVTRKRMLKIDKKGLCDFLEKIVPWTFFPSKMFQEYATGKCAIDYSKNTQEEIGFFCGKMWKCRNRVISGLKKQGIPVINSHQHTRRGKVYSDDNYIEMMQKVKYGIVLGGRSTMVTDKKNRREIDYMILKKPLLIDYKPCYYEKLIPGEHYIYIDQNTDIKNLENEYDIDKIAESGFNWYNRNASREGVASSFKKIILDKFEI